MNSIIYYNEISSLLTMLSYQINREGRLNLHDINIYTEYFYRDFLNTLYSLNLVNANDLTYNEPGIDLADASSKIMVQVSSTATKEKIQSSLEKADKAKYHGFHFYFLSISKPTEKLKEKSYSCPDEFMFNSKNDIYDIDDILRKVLSADVEVQKELSHLSKNQLEPIAPDRRQPSALAAIVESLAKDPTLGPEDLDSNAFDISDKVNYNQLATIHDDIRDAAIYSSILDKIYRTCENAGKAPRIKIQSILKSEYLKNKTNLASVRLYYHMVEYVVSKVCNSNNLSPNLFQEDIEWGAKVIVADAFQSCKIFEHPKN